MVSAPMMLIAGLVAGLVLEYGVLRLVRRPGWLARPNDRSSHVSPTPTMGGIAIVLVVLTYLSWLGTMDARLGWGMGGSLALLALIGLWDDLAELGAGVRLLVHLGASVALLWSLDLHQSWLTLAVLVLAVVWFVNLFNFMDGIDGFAAVQTLIFCLGAQWVSAGIVGWSGDLLWLLTGATIGFGVFNWPPARIFMGDVGSGFLGLLIGGLILYLWQIDELPLIAALILLSAFWFDATYTLCVRILTGQRFTQAHRLHLYQHAAQRYGHLWTTVVLLGFGVLWLVPWASFAASAQLPEQVSALVAAIAPLALLCWRFGAGLPQVPRPGTEA